MFTMFFSVVGAFIIGRAVRDTLFLAELPPAKLAPIYIAQSIALGIVSYAYALVAQRIRRDRLVIITPLVLGVTVILARSLLGTGTWILYALYLWIDVIGTIAILEFWTFANELYHARDGKRLFGFIAAGSTVANILVGVAVSALATRIGAKNLLFVCAGLLGLAALLGVSAARRLRHLTTLRDAADKAAAEASAKPMRKRGDRRALIRVPHVIAIVLVVIATYLAVTLVDFQFKAVAAASYGGDRDRLAEYFGNFYSVTGVVSLVVQLAITGRLLERFGVVGTLAVLPVLLAGTSAALVITPALWAATACKGSEHVLRYTVNDAGMQLLYMPLSANVRGRAKAFIEGVVKPGAQVLAGTAVLVVGSRSDAISHLSFAAIALTCLWVIALLRLRVTYIGSLRETLRSRRARVVAHDEQALASYAPVIARELREGDADEIAHALEIATSVNVDLTRLVVPLLGHARASIRRLACDYVVSRVVLREAKLRTKRGTYKRRFETLVGSLLDDPDADVRAAAIAAYCALEREQGVTRVAPLLTKKGAVFSADAIAGVARFGGKKGQDLARSILDKLAHDPDVERREEAAHALADLGAPFASLLLPLLEDKEFRVRHAAVLAAAKARGPSLIRPLIAALGQPALARNAAIALTQYGPGIEAYLERIDEASAPHALANVPGILSRLGTPRAASMLTSMVDSKNEAIRRQACKGLARRSREAKNKGMEEKIDRERLTNACSREIEIAYRSIAAAEAVEPTVRLTHQNASSLPNAGDPGAAAAMLVSSLLEKREGALDRAFYLLQVLFPAAEADALRDGVKDPDEARRANAIEILDGTIEGPLRAQLLPLLDDTTRAEKIKAGASFFTLPGSGDDEQAGADAWIAELLEDENAWVRACAAHYAGATVATHVTPKLHDLLEHDREPIVRESALAALENLASSAELKSIAEKALRDEFLPLKKRADRLLSSTADVAALPTGSPLP